MKIFKKFIFCFVLVVVTALLTFGITAFLLKTETPMCQSNPFYRPQEMLKADGIEIVDLEINQQNALHKRIRDYYAGEYRQILRKKYEDQLSWASSSAKKGMYSNVLENLPMALIAPPEFSEPREYEGLEGIVGIMASTSVYIPENGHLTGDGSVFFFQREDDAFHLKKVLPVGEDYQTYELMPVERFKREM